MNIFDKLESKFFFNVTRVLVWILLLIALSVACYSSFLYVRTYLLTEKVLYYHDTTVTADDIRAARTRTEQVSEKKPRAPSTEKAKKIKRETSLIGDNVWNLKREILDSLIPYRVTAEGNDPSLELGVKLNEFGTNSEREIYLKGLIETLKKYPFRARMFILDAYLNHWDYLFELDMVMQEFPGEVDVVHEYVEIKRKRLVEREAAERLKAEEELARIQTRKSLETLILPVVLTSSIAMASLTLILVLLKIERNTRKA